MDPAAIEQLASLERRHWWFRGRRAVYLGLIRHELRGRTPRRILDIGCGAGGFVEGLEGLGGSVVALDADAGLLARCGERARGRRLLGEGERLPFADGSFDLACLFDVLEHLDDDRAALREARRVLAPGGQLFVSVPAWPILYNGNDRAAHHRRRYTRESLARAFRESGLEVERNTCANVFLFPLIAPLVLATKALERLRPARRQGVWTNLSWRVPPIVNGALFRLFALELPLARAADLPLGHSIAAIARATSTAR